MRKNERIHGHTKNQTHEKGDSLYKKRLQLESLFCMFYYESKRGLPFAYFIIRTQTQPQTRTPRVNWLKGQLDMLPHHVTNSRSTNLRYFYRFSLIHQVVQTILWWPPQIISPHGGLSESPRGNGIPLRLPPRDKNKPTSPSIILRISQTSIHSDPISV